MGYFQELWSDQPNIVIVLGGNISIVGDLYSHAQYVIYK